MILTVTLNAAIDKTYWVPRFQAGMPNRVVKQVMEAGGKGVNVAKVLTSLGKEVAVTGFVGGVSGRMLQKNLKELNLTQHWVELDGETRTCLNIIDEELTQETELLEQGIHVSKADWKLFLMNFERLIDAYNLILISGSLPSGLQSDAYGELISIIKASGKKVGIDTSGLVLRKSIECSPMIIKPNIIELEDYCGKSIRNEEEVVQEALKLYDCGIPYVFVSLGKEGAIGISHQGVFRAQIPSIKSVNTVGSGDATFAGIGMILAEKDDMESALKSGMAAGMANAIQERSGRVEREDYSYFLKRISIKKLAEVKE